eukprot:Ihof_evm3s289 gene=Ihof_evmTU3s289
MGRVTKPTWHDEGAPRRERREKKQRTDNWVFKKIPGGSRGLTGPVSGIKSKIAKPLDSFFEGNTIKKAKRRRIKVQPIRDTLPHPELLQRINRCIHEKIIRAEQWKKQCTLNPSALLALGVLAQVMVHHELRQDTSNLHSNYIPNNYLPVINAIESKDCGAKRKKHRGGLDYITNRDKAKGEDEGVQHDISQPDSAAKPAVETDIVDQYELTGENISINDINLLLSTNDESSNDSDDDYLVRMIERRADKLNENNAVQRVEESPEGEVEVSNRKSEGVRLETGIEEREEEKDSAKEKLVQIEQSSNENNNDSNNESEEVTSSDSDSSEVEESAICRRWRSIVQSIDSHRYIGAL